MTNEEFQKLVLDKLDTMATKADLIKMENNIVSKIGALFDARETTIDEYERVGISLVKLESKVERLTLRVNSLDAKVG